MANTNYVKLPPNTDPFELAYSRVTQSNAPTPELQVVRNGLRKRLSELLMDFREHFTACDESGIERLLLERDSIGEQASALLSTIHRLQEANGLRTVSQSNFQDKVDRAKEKLSAFQPRNRTIAPLSAVAEDEAEQKALGQAVDKAKQEAANNQRNIVQTGAQLRELWREYRGLQAREETIAETIAELRLPPEQRRKHSSIVWSDGDSVFSAQAPYRT